MVIPDWLFYPLSAFFAAILIAVSYFYWPGQTHQANPFDVSPESELVITGQQLTLMQAAQGLSTQTQEEDGIVFLRTAAGQGPDDGNPSAGVFLTLPKAFSLAYGEKAVEITMIVRGGGANPSPAIILAYYSPGRGNSPRQKCNLDALWRTCTLTYTPPAANQNTNVDYVGMWPDLEGLSRAADIREIRIKPRSSRSSK
ncbi:MAG: hypothetical protein COA84_05335 [Robiginitomaculum sp.]|nr:MAG: hypothetical protein COA84_05335 [Robiginitomaculum sp.]